MAPPLVDRSGAFSRRRGGGPATSPLRVGEPVDHVAKFPGVDVSAEWFCAGFQPDSVGEISYDDGVESEIVYQARDDVQVVCVVTREADRLAAGLADRPRFVLEIAVAHVIEGLDDP